MRGAVLYAPGDVRVEERDDPRIIEPTDAILRLSASCVCGSDLWPYRGIAPVDGPSPMGHEYVGVVQEVGSQVSTIRSGQFVVGSFFASDNTCELCQAGYQSACLHREPIGALGAQAELLRVPLADGTLVATPEPPPDDLVPSLLAASDVLGTGWFAAVAAEAGPGGWAPIAWSRGSAPASRCCRPSGPPGRAATSASSGSPMGWSPGRLVRQQRRAATAPRTAPPLPTHMRPSRYPTRTPAAVSGYVQPAPAGLRPAAGRSRARPSAASSAGPGQHAQWCRSSAALRFGMTPRGEGVAHEWADRD
jgi:Alcohol dehydrogenase GroES-like domain